MAYNKPLFNFDDSSLLVIFPERKYYDEAIEYVKFVNLEVPFADLYKENFFYGLFDKSGDLVEPINIENNFSTFFSEEGGEQKIQNFVGDALNDMKKYLSTSLIANKISNNTPYTNIKIYRSRDNLTNDVISVYIAYATFYKAFAFNKNKENSLVVDHRSFVKRFINYLSNNLKNQKKITKTGIILSNNFSNFVSGLVFDISKDSCNNDENKFNKYLNSIEFSCFKEACVRFGFRIDKNIPWRLIADIESPAMKPYLEKYSIKNLDDLFKQRYKKVYLDEIDFLKSLFYKSYIYFFKGNEYYEKDIDTMCARDFNKRKLLIRDIVSYEQFSRDIPDEYWLRVFAYFRNIETSSNLTQQKFDNIVREAQQLVRYGKQDEAIKYLNKYFDVFKQAKKTPNIPNVNIIF